MQDSMKRSLQALRSGTLTNRLDQIELANDVLHEHARLERLLYEMAKMNSDLIDQTGSSVDIVGVE